MKKPSTKGGRAPGRKRAGTKDLPARRTSGVKGGAVTTELEEFANPPLNLGTRAGGEVVSDSVKLRPR